jgi:two-component system response regulator HydG
MSNRKKLKVVVADDDAGVGRSLDQRLREQWAVFPVGDPVSLYAKIVEESPTLLLLDTRFGKSLDIVRELLAAQPQLLIVMLASTAQLPIAQTATKLGAFDIVAKPIDHERLQTVLKHATDVAALRSRAAELETLIAHKDSFDLMIGDSEAMRQTRQQIAALAPLDTPVLIQGDPGTNKELAARAIHDRSERRRGPFLLCNAATLPGPLVERMLFGFEKGAFPGVDHSEGGLLDAANGGTLLIDEVQLLEPGVQMKLNKLLQDGTFMPLGGTKSRQSDVRLVIATSDDLAERVKQGRFRKDLYERFATSLLRIQPLKARREDIPLLARRALTLATARLQRNAVTISPSALEKLCQYDWPNNDRQLEMTMDRVAATLKGDEIDDAALPTEVMSGLHVLSIASALFASTATQDTNLKPIELVEKKAILDALAKTGGHVGKASQLLGYGQATVYRKVKRYGITPDMRGRPKRGRKPKLRIATQGA